MILDLIQNYNYTWSDAVGNVGVVILLITFYLNVEGKINSTGLVYNVANLVVAILLTINLIYKPNLSSFIIEFVWAGIAIKGIYNNIRQNSKSIVK